MKGNAMKKLRQDKIIEIIWNNDITTQEMLKGCLEAENIAVTQATLSRDIKELKLKKEPSADGILRYVKPVKKQTECPPIFRDSVYDVLYAMNTVVIKCQSGMAQAACATLDKMDFPEIVGTVSGDDTIFALTKTESEASAFTRELRELIGKQQESGVRIKE